MEEFRQQTELPGVNPGHVGMEAALLAQSALDASQNTRVQPDQIHSKQLHKVFADFNRVAVALDESYQALEQRVDSLKKDLSEARLAQQYDQAEKDRLANRLASLVSVLPSAVLVLNRHSLIIDRNPLASQALNEPLIGLSWQQVIERENLVVSSTENEIRLRDGRIFSVARDGLAVSSDSAIFLTDVTEIHRAQNDMARNKRLTAMGEMAASMAHQIRTPLSSAHLYMSPLGRTDIQPKQRTEILGKIQNRLSHIGTLVDSMLGFVRGTRADMHAVPVQEVLSMLASLVAEETQRCNAELTIDEVGPEIAIHADKQALVDALSNLVINAYQVTNEGRPRVQVNVQTVRGQQLEIRVRDRGPGIAPDKLEKIFDPFYTTRSTGTGLGLAIAAMTCEQHGGRIQALNHPQGGGLFIIQLPLYKNGEKTLCHKDAAVENQSKQWPVNTWQEEVA